MYVFSGSSRTEEAAELYTKAGNTFKMAKKWAGKLYYYMVLYVIFISRVLLSPLNSAR